MKQIGVAVMICDFTEEALCLKLGRVCGFIWRYFRPLYVRRLSSSLYGRYFDRIL